MITLLKREDVQALSHNKKSAGLGVLAVILVLCELASLTVLFGRMAGYSSVSFDNVMPLMESSRDNGLKYAPNVSYPAASPSVGTPVTPPSSGTGDTGNDETTAVDIGAVDTDAGTNAADTAGNASNGNSTAHPEFYMVAEAEIFKFSYDETGKITVIGPDGNTDKLIAPGTSNTYQFTLENPGNVALDYTLTMEAYITGTDLYLPVNARVWDYKNKYLVGSSDGMVDVLELNTVNETAELGAGRYAVYNLEWEWPFEWGDDVHDTLLGDLAVDNDIFLTIIIRTVAEYDEDPDDPESGIPPQTGDESNTAFLWMVCVVSLLALCLLLFAGRRRERDDDELKVQ